MSAGQPGTHTTLPLVAHWLRGLGLLMALAALGEALAGGLHLPIPGSVLGMLLLWALLSAGLFKLQWFEPAADHLLGVLGLLFVPATVGFMEYLSAGAAIVTWLLVALAGLLLGSAAAAFIAQRLLRPDQPFDEALAAARDTQVQE